MGSLRPVKLSIIIPTYNEHSTIEELIGYVQSVPYPVEHEIIIVDDASIDRTYEKEVLIRMKNRTESNNIRLFKNVINRGKGFSIRKGIRRCTGDIIIIQDADKEYDPHEIPKLLEPILAGKTDVVYGSRFLNAKRPEGMAFANWVANRFLTWVTNVLYGLNLTDLLQGFPGGHRKKPETAGKPVHVRARGHGLAGQKENRDSRAPDFLSRPDGRRRQENQSQGFLFRRSYFIEIPFLDLEKFPENRGRCFCSSRDRSSPVGEPA